ncbi:uncharacterized protein DUF4241 [Chitinophaga dinghuensis]|uniref:Uncharacterized protein DUF4241 n=1 Tax=Chitinophaga dinghuensis TaxID=1539050 RepID=A0A327VSP1_9BACT|nr:DUF4241 domain-containing protein [Chitinophaga dinghuensis]RAJ77387.1 uncharacterized protein DUF4241 [Chitinophaga dinghuensis]
MSALQIPAFLESAFVAGTTSESGARNCTFYTVNPGQLKITSGQLIACDPFILDLESPFSTVFPTGEFPVQLGVAKFEDDERVAFARIKFSEEQPVSWNMALCEGDDISTLKADEIFGYGVDAGTGAFMDITAAEELDEFLQEKDDNYDQLTEEMEKTYAHTRSWMMWNGKAANAAFFSSGWGDGFYGSYIGYDAGGNICRLVTDFGVVF